MDQVRELRDWWRSVRYGLDVVYPTRARQIFIEIAAPDLAQLSFTVDQGRFVMVIKRDITHLIGLVSLRGAYCLQWGVSLSFLPHSWKTRVRWHRTPKSARFDLFEAPAIMSELPLHEFDLVVADATHGETFLREDLHRLWKVQRREILDWLAGITSIEDVVEKARSQREGEPNWHSPPPGLVEAFALAKLGNVDEARALLDQVVQEHRESLEPIDNLRQIFGTIEARN